MSGEERGGTSRVTFRNQASGSIRRSQDTQSDRNNDSESEAEIATGNEDGRQNSQDAPESRLSQDPTNAHEGRGSQETETSQGTQDSGTTLKTQGSPEANPFKERRDSQRRKSVSPRVRFRSDAKPEAQSRPPSPQDADSEQEDAGRMSGRRDLFSPYAHEKDISDIPLEDQGGTDGAITDGETSEKSEKEEEEAEPVNRSHRTSKAFQGKWRKFNRNIRDSTARIAGRFGREREGGDDLTQGVYHPDWAAGGEAPLSDIPDDKHRSLSEKKEHHQATSSSEAHRLVRELTQDQATRRRIPRGKLYPHGDLDYREGQADMSLDPELRYRAGGGGVLSHLMKLNTGKTQERGRSPTPSSSDGTTPRGGTPGHKKGKMKWYKKPVNASSANLSDGGSASGAGTPISSEALSAASKRRGKGGDRKVKLEDEIRVTVQIAEIIARQRYIMQLCKALMKFGAPTHRLEEYMQMTSKVLEVDSQFLYLPGCMIMAFDDPSTRTTEVKLIRVAQSIDLSRLAHTHSVYKNVVHDIIGVEEAIQTLEDIMHKKPRFNKLMVVLVYGLATTSVGPFAFDARPIDMPIIFFNGCLLATMQHIAAPRSALYSNVFEVTATVLTSFLARAFGSIRSGQVDGRPTYYFCFSAIAQASIALILPGFLVLTSSLELQSHQIIAGSIRMVYAIIYSLFLGYGITVGTTIYGLMDADANSQTTCPSTGAFPNPYVHRFPFVALGALFLLIVNQGRWKQAPVMVTIALAGYVTNYFCTQKLGSNSQVANTVGAFTIGIMGNLYSRLWHGHAATAILPGIFVLVPSALAATGTLISGVQSANAIRSNVSHPNATHGGQGQGGLSNTSVFNLGFGMIQVAIGITIGLFLAALIIYPYGKRRSGLFSF